MKLAGEPLEYAISQYVDGTLSDLDRRVLEDQLAVDFAAQALVSEYAALNESLRTSNPLPAIDFARFHASVSAAIHHERVPVARPMVLRRTAVGFMALAAAIALAVTAGVHFMPTSGPSNPGTVEVASSGTLQIRGPAIEVATTTPSIRLSVGPSEALAKRGDRLSLGDDLIVTPSPRVVISAANRDRKSDVPLY